MTEEQRLSELNNMERELEPEDYSNSPHLEKWETSSVTYCVGGVFTIGSIQNWDTSGDAGEAIDAEKKSGCE